MEPVQAVILGAVQGLTEFFPVSSSGHLVIFQQLMGFKEPDLLFDISVHVGTLVAIVAYFYSDIAHIIKALLLSLPGRRKRHDDKHTGDPENADINMAQMIVIGSLPTALVGAGLYMKSNLLFSSLVIVGVSLLITGGILMVQRWIKQRKRPDATLSVKEALLIGTVQGIAVIPGISRSGATISAALMAGVDKDTAIRYSFLLSIPAILGALLLQLVTGSSGAGNAGVSIILIGLVTSFVVGYAALSFLVRMVQRGRLYYFAPYCILLGGMVIVAGW